MATINFRTYGKGKLNAPVYIRFVHTREHQHELKSGIIIPNSDWLEKSKTRKIAQFTNQLIVQDKLDELRSAISKALTSTTIYSKEWLQSVVDEFNGVSNDPNPTIVEVLDKYVSYISTTANVTRERGTVKTYQTSKKRIENFQKYIGKVYRINQVDIEFKNAFVTWARNVENYQSATFIKTVKQLKTLVRFAKRLGYQVNESLLNDTETLTIAKVKGSPKKPLFLSPDEICQLMKFQGSNYLTNARDWLVISCWTGCRVSDLMKLSEDNIHNTINGTKAIRYIHQKTGATVSTPFHPHVKEIFERNGGFPRKTSSQKYNEYIKEVCRLVGFVEVIEGGKNDPKLNRKVFGKFPKYELITTHIGRRSFATNHYGKFPTEKIMMVTGHSTVRQFLVYVGENPDEHVSDFMAYYENNTSFKPLQSLDKELSFN
jgi:integrase